MDVNRQRFETRLRILDESPGIVARAIRTRRNEHFRKREQAPTERRLDRLRSAVRIFMTIVFFFLGKAISAEFIGTERYDTQVTALSTSEGWRPLVALIMQRGPAMKWVEPGISKILELDPNREVLAAEDWPVFMQVKGKTGE